MQLLNVASACTGVFRQPPWRRGRPILALRGTHRTMLSLLATLLFGTLPARAISQESATPTTAAAPPQPAEHALQGYEFIFPAMGTQVELKAFHTNQDEVQQAFTQVQQRVAELETILTDYDPASETRQLSSRASGRWVAVSDPLWQVLVASERWQQISHGAFDSSLGQLTQLWRKYRRVSRLPSDEELHWARQHSGWQHVQLDKEHGRVRFTSHDVRLDFGAIGKGFVVDQAFAILEQRGLQRTLVNISGNMRVGDPPPERNGWRIEIAPLQPGGQPLRRIEVAHTSLATSGDLWQFKIIDGVRRSHILDPSTGIGIAGPVCATAISPTATDADALATTACIIGFDRAQQIASTFDDTHLLWAKEISRQPASTNSGGSLVHIQLTPGFPAALGSPEGKQ